LISDGNNGKVEIDAENERATISFEQELQVN